MEDAQDPREKRSNINRTAVKQELDERLAAARTAVEAAGEVLLSKDKQQALGAISRESCREMDDVIVEWLATSQGLDESAAKTSFSAAATYARFLGDRVTFDPSSDPMAEIDAAWREWRERP